MFEEEPFRVAVPPGFAAVMILLNHHAEFDTCFPVAMIAKLVHANHFSFACILSHDRSDKRGANEQRGRQA